MAMQPPLPPPLPTAAQPQLPTKPPRRNGCLIALVVAVALLVPLAGILAAIAIPAYQTYVLRSRVAAVIAATQPARAAIDARLAQASECPANDSDSAGMQGIARIEAGPLAEDPSRCVQAIHLGGTGSDKLDGRTIWMDRAKAGDARWSCRSDLDDSALPAACREH